MPVGRGLSDQMVRAPSLFCLLYYPVMLRMLNFLAAAAVARPATAAIYKLMSRLGSVEYLAAKAESARPTAIMAVNTSAIARIKSPPWCPPHCFQVTTAS
jgi:hypothetical protein